MTRWLSDFLVGRVIQVNVNGFLSDKISPIAGVPQGSVLSPLLFLIYVNDFPNPHHRQNSKSQFADDTALWAASKNVQFAAKRLRKDLRKLAKWCAKWRIKLNPEKTKVIIFSRSPLARKSEPILKLYGERLKIYPQVKFLGITFDSKLTFQKHFEEILGRCNTRYHRVRLIVNKKWGPSPSTTLQIYKQCVRRIFEYGSLSTITMSDIIISKIQRLQNKFIRLALRLPQYISIKLLHDSSGLPYVKDRLLSCATRTLERISKNPLVEESITFNRVNPAWDRFPTPLSVIHPVSLWTNMTYRGNFSKHPVAPETGSLAYTRTRLTQSSDLELKPTQATLPVCLSWDALGVPQAVGSKRGHPSTSYSWSLSLTVSPITNFCT